MNRTVIIGTAAVVAVATACGDGDGGGAGTGPDAASFQATVTGDLNLTLSGTAVFGVDTTQGQAGFVIALMRGTPGSDDSDIIVIGRDNTATPGVGTHAIVSGRCTTCSDDDFAALFAHQETIADFGLFLSEAGSFTLESVNADRMQGSFSFTASVFLSSGNVTADTLMLRGTFTAQQGQVPSIGP